MKAQIIEALAAGFSQAGATVASDADSAAADRISVAHFAPEVA